MKNHCFLPTQQALTRIYKFSFLYLREHVSAHYSQKLKKKNRNPANRREPEGRRQKQGGGSQKAEARRQKPEGRSQKGEGEQRGRRPEAR